MQHPRLLPALFAQYRAVQQVCSMLTAFHGMDFITHDFAAEYVLKQIQVKPEPQLYKLERKIKP